MAREDWDDPHDLVPEAFANTYPNADSVSEALRHAERLPSSTPAAERPTCPECDSVGISPVGTGQGGTSRWDWVCNECENRFNEPDKPDMDRYNDTEHLRFQFQDDESLLDPKWRTELDRPFDYPDELADPDERGMGPLFAGLDRETMTALVLVLREPWTDSGGTYKEIAELLPYQRTWVGNRVREWRDGEHRELVPDPTAEPEPAPNTEPPIDPSVAVARIGGDYEELVAERAASTDASSDTGAVATDGGRRSRWDAYGG